MASKFSVVPRTSCSKNAFVFLLLFELLQLRMVVSFLRIQLLDQHVIVMCNLLHEKV